jgi:hypothetical protein
MTHYTSMTLEEIIAANKKSAEEEAASKALHAHDFCSADRGCKECRDWYQAQQPPREHYNFIGDADTRDSTLDSIERENVEASRTN